MERYRVDFASMPWEQRAAGVRSKAYEHDGRRVRLAEFTRDFVEPDWCVKGHIGYVLEGEMELDFRGRVVTLRAGDGLFIPPGTEHGHKARVLTDCVKIVLVEDVNRAEADIALATEQDLPVIRVLFREYEASLPFDLSFQNFEEELKALPGRYGPPSGRILLAKHGDAFVGCVALRQIGDGLCEMKRLFVQPALRGKGIGKALARAVIEEARRIGYKRMRLDTVLEPAKGLYRSLGFREIPPYQHVPIEGVVFMELEL